MAHHSVGVEHAPHREGKRRPVKARQPRDAVADAVRYRAAIRSERVIKVRLDWVVEEPVEGRPPGDDPAAALVVDVPTALGGCIAIEGAIGDVRFRNEWDSGDRVDAWEEAHDEIQRIGRIDAIAGDGIVGELVVPAHAAREAVESRIVHSKVRPLHVVHPHAIRLRLLVEVLHEDKRIRGVVGGAEGGWIQGDVPSADVEVIPQGEDGGDGLAVECREEGRIDPGVLLVRIVAGLGRIGLIVNLHVLEAVGIVRRLHDAVGAEALGTEAAGDDDAVEIAVGEACANGRLGPDKARVMHRLVRPFEAVTAFIPDDDQRLVGRLWNGRIGNIDRDDGPAGIGAIVDQRIVVRVLLHHVARVLDARVERGS